MCIVDCFFLSATADVTWSVVTGWQEQGRERRPTPWHLLVTAELLRVSWRSVTVVWWWGGWTHVTWSCVSPGLSCIQHQNMEDESRSKQMCFLFRYWEVRRNIWEDPLPVTHDWWWSWLCELVSVTELSWQPATVYTVQASNIISVTMVKSCDISGPPLHSTLSVQCSPCYGAIPCNSWVSRKIHRFIVQFSSNSKM